MKRNTTGLAAAASVAAVLVVLAAPATVAAAQPSARPATPPGLACETGRHAVDNYTGYALCRNNGNAPQTFWVHLVCGWSPDQDGEHVTLNPGQSGQSTAHCSSLGTGIGEITVRP
jgi:hypothetical protein